MNISIRPLLKIIFIMCFSLSAGLHATERTALQKHVDFFDSDGDGIITIGETVDGLKRLGICSLKAYALGAAIHIGLEMKTRVSGQGKLGINANNIHKGKHDSDTGAYDEHGKFVAKRLNDMFTKFDLDADGALSEEEMKHMLDDQKEGFVGHQASKLEFGLLMDIAGEDRDINGKATRVLTREVFEKLYDGSLFHAIAAKNTGLSCVDPVSAQEYL